MTPNGMSKAQQEFVAAQARKLLIRWCQLAISDEWYAGDDDSVRRTPGLAIVSSWSPNVDAMSGLITKSELERLNENPYLAYAISKGWVSLVGKLDGNCFTVKVLAAGYSSAARALRK